MLGDIFQTKYTNDSVGQRIYEGWLKAGTKQMQQYQQQNETARAKEATAVLEEAALQAIRTANGITAGTNDDQKRANRRQAPPEEEDDDDVNALFG